jgi:hypothetical protein
MNNPTTSQTRSFGMYTPAGDAAVAPLVARSIDAVIHGASVVLVLQRLHQDLSALEAIYPGATDTVVRDTVTAAIINAGENAAVARGKTKLVAKFGCIGADHDEVFHSYPEDGACPCGVHKHHVHCTCGGITQVG